MGFLKKVILAIIAFVLILWGGSGTQASSLWLQGGGFIGLIAGIIIIYIFGKMASRAMGCLPSLIILAGIIGFIIYVPFIVLDLVVANILLALGMFMLSPQIVSTPFKLLIFIAVDGWSLIVKGLVESFN